MYVYHIVIYDVLTCNLNVSLNIIYASTVQRINTSICQCVNMSLCQPGAGNEKGMTETGLDVGKGRGNGRKEKKRRRILWPETSQLDESVKITQEQRNTHLHTYTHKKRKNIQEQ